MPGIDNKRFSTLVQPHLDALFRAAWRLTRNRADAEDLVQETCIRACRRLDELREPVKPWLLRVMHNLFVDEARRLRSSPIDARESLPQAERASPDPTPEQSLEIRQRMAQIEQAWCQLDAGHRALLALRAEGCSIAEIVAITDIPADALSMRLHRARQNLTRCLQQLQAPSNLPKEACK
jgi:RNA polymerase sigma-70 factor (ECF subfamily)